MASTEMLAAGEIDVWRAHLDGEAAGAERLLRLLSAEERERADRFRFAVDRQRFIVARGVLRLLLARYLDCDTAELEFIYGRHEKPALARPDGADVLAFNLSHSGGISLYAMTRQAEVGIDLEQVRSAFPVEEIAARFFAPEEATALLQLPPAIRQERFFTYWTRKEAYSKARGEGLSLDSRRIDASLPEARSFQPFPLRVDGFTDAAYSLCDLEVGPGWAGALAVHGCPRRVIFREWEGAVKSEA